MSRNALLVLGMHRSGTSAIAGLLVRLGAHAPKTLMLPNADNPEGYWESAAFHEFHEHLLRSLGSRWDAFAQVDDDGPVAPDVPDAERRCAALLRSEFGDSTPFVLKDPRICRLIPFWLRVLNRESIVPVVVLVHRHPIEVAGSLRARNGFETERSLLIWLRHVLNAEFETRSLRRAFVRYPDMLDDWKSSARRILRDIGTMATGLSLHNEGAIDQFLSRGLHHHRVRDNGAMDIPAVLADWVHRTWAAIEELHKEKPEETVRAFETLDAVRQEFDRASAVFGRLGELPPPELIERCEVLTRHLGELTARFEALDREHAGLRGHAAALETSRNEIELKSHALHVELEATRERERALRRSVSWRITGPLRAAVRIFR